MKYLLALAVLLVPFPAAAGISITVSVGSVQEVWNLSDADQQQFEAWVKAVYKCAPQPSCTPLTLAQSETLWAKGMVQRTADEAKKFHDMSVSATASTAALLRANPPPKSKGPPPDDKAAPKK